VVGVTVPGLSVGLVRLQMTVMFLIRKGFRSWGSDAVDEGTLSVISSARCPGEQPWRWWSAVLAFTIQR